MLWFQHIRSMCRVLGCFSEFASQAVWKKKTEINVLVRKYQRGL